MILQKISTFLVAVSLIVPSVVGLGYFTAAPASALVADSIPERPSQCPVDGFASINFNIIDEYRIDSEFVSTLVLNNTSSYALNGVRIGLGIYSDASQIIPDFWFVSDEQYQLSANEIKNVDVAIDASSMPAGEYVVRSFTMQGDEVAVLGAIMRGGSSAPSTIVKTAPKTSDVTVSVAVNGEVSNGQTIVLESGENIAVQVQTKNENELPFVNSSLVVAISQGDVPLGAALRESINDSVKLLPNATRETQALNRFTESGDYSVYAALLTKNAFQAVEYIPVTVGSEPGVSSWAYLSRVGVSDQTLKMDSEIVGCINYLGEAAELQGVIETLAMNVSVTDGDTELFSSEVRTQDMRQSFLLVRPELSLQKSTVTATLLQERFPSVIGREDEAVQEVSGDTEIFLAPVQTLTFLAECASEDGCDSSEELGAVLDTGSGNDTAGSNSFYFYAAIVIAAALLLYIMLRRLHPEEPLAAQTNSNELQ